MLYIEPKGHGIEAFHGEDQLEDATGVVVYRHTGEAAAPTGLSGSGAVEEVGYDLVSMAETLWPFARDQYGQLYGGVFDYSRWTVEVLDSDDRVATREVTLGEVGSLFSAPSADETWRGRLGGGTTRTNRTAGRESGS